ncbi:hypothetical protein CEUSTIGMA_g9128.t1 [Chlamydomonas eustigma]|uniref:Uncharacterized protein n=1 Tax=Chlamydomonas eustigma TaxID=1157962 RepID=A0A250XFZ0_9CHLO|nr:hypothetical protein CEUSTIGMA_g9128.t1 [Chlamydomonas eustigma]|eukprot:GAX81700.1 hypothetical protein CEUSTIGMA_g9128.t1 [Chlamydomonas eustigma]
MSLPVTEPTFSDADKRSYLKRVSKSLRRQLSRPVTKTAYNPTFDTTFDAAPTIYSQGQIESSNYATSALAGASMQTEVLHHPSSSGHLSIPLPQHLLPQHLQSHGFLQAHTFECGQDVTFTFPAKSVIDACDTSPSAAPQVIEPIGSAIMVAPLSRDQYMRPVLSPRSRKGTRSGPYEGYASGRWLEIEMRNEIDDLAHNVDKYASRRVNKAADEEKIVLLEKIAQFEKQVSQLLRKIKDMELLLPGEDGQYKLLQQELKELEQDCDYYYNLYLEEVNAKMAEKQAVGDALRHLNDMETEFARIKGAVEGPTGLLVSTSAAEGGDGQAGPDSTKQTAADNADRGKAIEEQQWPNVPRILTRLALVILFLGCIAAAILGTYFVMKG